MPTGMYTCMHATARTLNAGRAPVVAHVRCSIPRENRKGTPFRTIIAGTPFKAGKEAKTVDAALKAKCWAATEAAIAPFLK